ncbi:hypothetical protein CP970_06180 [Streptomyces kanamyceticus]|uniref:Uncharacterized protein n=1 Tax=Streptomyces kanamyceticus TaxID=1967 RepID=A0A5J6G6D9_STRKN|nr:hypothetical protein CP970_06180 [Streptomyces kanamyceticus]
MIVREDRAGLYSHQERIRSKGSGQDSAWVEEVRAGYRMLLSLDVPEVWENDTVLVVEARDEQAAEPTYR